MRVSLVPCDGCTACCQGDAVFLYPEAGDDLSTYQVERFGDRFVLAHQEDGDCIYLSREIGCTIYDSRPALCRELDCRVWLKLPKPVLDAAADAGLIRPEQLAAARQRAFSRPMGRIPSGKRRRRGRI